MKLTVSDLTAVSIMMQFVHCNQDKINVMILLACFSDFQ